LKPEYIPGEDLDAAKRIIGANFLIVFNNNYGSILLSFRDMTTNDGPTSETMAYLAVEAGQKQLHLHHDCRLLQTGEFNSMMPESLKVSSLMIQADRPMCKESRVVLWIPENKN